MGHIGKLVWGRKALLARGSVYLSLALSASFYFMENKPKMPTWKKWLGIVCGAIIFLMIVGGSSDKKEITAPVQSATAEPEVTKPTRSKEEIMKEIDDLMVLAKGANLVLSYDFSELKPGLYKGEVYVEKGWYQQPVTFKKDFVANFGLLKEELSGYSNIRFYDGYSNELVAEIDGFKGLQVYK